MTRGSLLVGLVFVLFILFTAARGTLHAYRLLLTQSQGTASALNKAANLTTP